MRIASLGSGSNGNGTIVQAGDTTLLIDLGFTLKETERRLRRLALDPAAIDAVFVTHEHADHVHGVPPFARKYGVPVYLSHGTHEAGSFGLLPGVHIVSGQRACQVGALRIEPVTVPHDAREPLQYVIEHEGTRVGVLTDLGHITPHVVESYAECDALLLECNHDVGMLARGRYPYQLKQRVGGLMGHLNNEQAAFLLGKVDVARLRYVVISHISQENNQPDIARRTVEGALARWSGQLLLAEQEAGLGWLELSSASSSETLASSAVSVP
jgi:phosphoribosyl 1,2-cyclic phosphodiesterase